MKRAAALLLFASLGGRARAADTTAFVGVTVRATGSS